MEGSSTPSYLINSYSSYRAQLNTHYIWEAFSKLPDQDCKTPTLLLFAAPIIAASLYVILHNVIYILCTLYFFKDFKDLFLREKGTERERERSIDVQEKLQLVASCNVPNQGCGLQPWPVP